MSTKQQLISFYRQLLRESKKLNSYNFRMYAERKIRDIFRSNHKITNLEGSEKQLQLARQNLELIRRQVIIGHLYTADKLVIEQKTSSSKRF